MAPVTPVDVHPVPTGTLTGTLAGIQPGTGSPARLVQNATAHLFNGRNALVDGLRTGVAPLQLGTEFIVLGFKFPTVKMDDRPEALQGGLKLLLGGLLAVTSLLHAAH